MRHPYTLWSDPVPHAGWLNMAIDETLLERAQAGERWLRLYAWEPTLSFGRHEPACRRYDADRVAALGLATVRRPTGGRAVWHAAGADLCRRLADRASSAPCAKPTGTFTWCCAMRSGASGVSAELAPLGRTASVDTGACFASPAGGEVVVAGGKVVGSAQLRRGAALLQHGSILLDDDQAVVARVTRGQAPVDRSLPLCRAAGRRVSWAEAAVAVTGAAEAAWGTGSPARPEQVSEILERAASSSEHFRSAAWTWSGLLDA